MNGSWSNFIYNNYLLETTIANRLFVNFDFHFQFSVNLEITSPIIIATTDYIRYSQEFYNSFAAQLSTRKQITLNKLIEINIQ